MKRIETSDGRFAAGDPVTRRPGSMVTSVFLNDLQDEVCNVIEKAGFALDGGDSEQLYKSIKAIVAAEFQGPVVVPTTPTEKGPQLIFVMDRLCHMTWVSTAFYTGYRSLLCGHWWGGSTHLPRAFEIDAQGDVYDIAEYPSLWGMANEQNMVVDAGDWEPKWGHYAKIGTAQFRVPDYRDMFQRMSGTDADTANARTAGSAQRPAVENHAHEVGLNANSNNLRSGVLSSSGNVFTVAAAEIGERNNGTGNNLGGKSETRPGNSAVSPFIHV